MPDVLEVYGVLKVAGKSKGLDEARRNLGCAVARQPAGGVGAGRREWQEWIAPRWVIEIDGPGMRSRSVFSEWRVARDSEVGNGGFRPKADILDGQDWGTSLSCSAFGRRLVSRTQPT